VLSACGWPSDACPPVAAAWARRGTVTVAAARRFGLPPGTPVCVGWSDALAQVLAAGCFERGSGFVFSGTSAIVGAPAAGRSAGLFGVPDSCAPAPLLYGPTQSSGASVAWVARLLGCRPADVPALAAQSSAGPWPAFVPYLSGERAPLWNADVRGLLLGLAAEHGPAEIARAVLTGTMLGARHVLDAVEEATGEPIGFDGPMRPDHVPALAGESNESYGYATLGRLFAVGYITGLRDATYGRPPTRYGRHVGEDALR
jgi:xylulokinase